MRLRNWEAHTGYGCEEEGVVLTEGVTSTIGEYKGHGRDLAMIVVVEGRASAILE